MSLIRVQEKDIFIHIPKNAGTSVENIIGGTSHKTIFDFSKEVNVNDYYKWCISRNPFSRMVSAFIYCQNKGWVSNKIGFKQYVDFVCWKISKYNGEYGEKELIEYSNCYLCGNIIRFFHALPQYYFVTIDGDVKMDAKVKMEEINDHFIFKKLNINIRKDNVTKNYGVYNAYYNRELEGTVYNAYLKDFIFFDYQKNLENIN